MNIFHLVNILINARIDIAIYEFISSQEHSYEKHNNKIEKEETLEESKNAINNQLHQPATESSEIKLDAAEVNENTMDQTSPMESKAISRSNSESETSPALEQPVETESVV